MDQLIRILRNSGYPGYEEGGNNSAAKVKQRLRDRYLNVYGSAAFTPAAISGALNVKPLEPVSMVQEKNATPAEPCKDVTDWEASLRPRHVMAERSAQSQGNIH